MRNNNFFITFGQVNQISYMHKSADLEKFTDFAEVQMEINKKLESDDNWNIAQQKINDREKYIQVMDETTDFDDIKNSFKTLNSNPNKKKISTVAILSVFVYELNSINSNVPKKIICYPLLSSFLEIPKKGDWVSVLGVSDNIISNTQSFNSFSYFYFPFSAFSKKFNQIAGINSLKDKTSGKVITNKAKNILWPRSGSTIIQNQNGKSHCVLDQSSILMSTGFKNFLNEIDGLEIENKKLHEFLRFNQPDNFDSFIFLDKHNLEWENQINEYRKKIFELNRFEDISTVDEILEKIYSANTFKKRIKLFQGIDFSDYYTGNYKDFNYNQDNDAENDSGILISAKQIYLSNNTQATQKDYTVARSEPLQDLLYGLIDIITDLTKEIINHQHAGSPAKVLQTIPGGAPQGTIATDIEQRLDKIKGQLDKISSSRVHIS